jgi:hypothetical protein
MGEGPPDDADSLAAFAEEPSAEVRSQLGAGIPAVLAAGALAVAGSVAELLERGVPGFTTAHALAWAALLPLLWVLRAYLVLARETDSPGLRKSSLCLYGTVVFANVLDLAVVDALPLAVRVVIWVVFAIGLLALLAAPFMSGSEPDATPAATPAPAAPEPGASATGRAGVVGGLVVALLVLLKLAGQGLIAKVLVVRWIARAVGGVNAETGEVLAAMTVLLLGVAFFLWFGVSKIRLRDQLGAFVVLVGWLEILLVITFVGWLTWLVAGVTAAAAQPGLAGQAPGPLPEWAVEATVLLGIGGTIAWVFLTAYLFAAARDRLAPLEG